MKKYLARIVSIGPLAAEFFEHEMIVFFGNSAPQELQDHSVVHDGKTLGSDVIPGDKIRIARKTFRVLAVGPLANRNLRSLGHLVLKFNGSSEVEMEGDINVTARRLPKISPGKVFSIQGS